MRLNLHRIAEAVAKDAADKTPAQVATLMKEVVALLAENGQIARWREFEVALNNAWAKVYGASSVTIVSASPLTTSAKAELEKRAAGADLTEIVDDRLIGGAIVRIDNVRIDGSVTGALMRLKQAMYSEV